VSGAIKTAVAVVVILAIAGAAITVLLRKKPPAWVPTSLPVVDDPVDAEGPAEDASAASTPSASVRKQTAPLSSAQLGAPLVNGAWVTA
jgi:hypothetical protein